MAIVAVEFPLNAKRLGPSIEAAVSILTSFTGVETVNPNRSQMRRTYNAAMGVKSLNDVFTLLTFWHAMGGPTTGFLVKDWIDFQTTRLATTHATGITSQGVATNVGGAVWQLQKKYTVGATDHLRTLTRPKAGGAIYFDGSLATVTTNYTYDTTTGLLTVVSGSPTAITHSLEFFVPCRFLQKTLPMDLLKYSNGSGIVDVPDIPLIEIL
ncbi:MAG: hypothetical protein V7638_3815 [Acidobacteriota bacterium]|jgi:uncharacterized protein (TIGR02217 family)